MPRLQVRHVGALKEMTEAIIRQNPLVEGFRSGPDRVSSADEVIQGVNHVISGTNETRQINLGHSTITGVLGAASLSQVCEGWQSSPILVVSVCCVICRMVAGEIIAASFHNRSKHRALP